jgi:anti-sigma regulatory factor (Ser/Thr protein kinase)
MAPGPAEDLEGMAERLIRAVHSPMEQYEQDDAPAAGRPAVPEELYGPRGRARAEAGGRLAPRNEDDIALLLLRRDSPVRRVAVPERRLLLTVGQEEAEGLAEARTELRSLLHDWRQEDQVDTAVLLASELVGNVLVHTDKQAALTATITGDPGSRRLRVEVTDRGDELPHQRAPGELASSGRGLMMLDLLALEWSVRPESEGKTVWFCLDEDQPPPAPPGL